MNTKKIDIKQRLSAVLTEDEDKKVREYVKEKEISINQFLRDAINLKLNRTSEREELDKDHKEWKQEFDKWQQKKKDNEEKKKYDNWVGKRTYFNGMRGY